MTYQTIPQFIEAHLFDGEIKNLQKFLDKFGDACAISLPKAHFPSEDVLITSTQEHNSTSIKVAKGKYIIRTAYDFFEAQDAEVFEAKYQPKAQDIET